MTAVVRTEHLSKRYAHTIALDDLELEIEAGEVFGYLGPNGAGKSTTIGLLLGLIRPSSGAARIFDLDAWPDAPVIHRRLAYVPSETNLWPSLTGAETLRFLGSIHGSIDADYQVELVDRFDLAVDKKIRAYSHGNRQKVPLIAAFASRAELLLLDEPTTGLDPLMEQVFRACVIEARDRGQTVLLSSHVLIDLDAGGAGVDQWFCASALFGTRISAPIAVRTYRALAQAGVHGARRGRAELGRPGRVAGCRRLRPVRFPHRDALATARGRGPRSLSGNGRVARDAH